MLKREELGLTASEYSELIFSEAEYVDFKIIASQYIHPFPAYPNQSPSPTVLRYRRFVGASNNTYAEFNQLNGNISFVQNGSPVYSITDIPHTQKTYVAFKIDGTRHLAAYLATTVESDLFVMASNNSGDSWSSFIISPPAECSFVAMDASSANRIHLVAYHLSRKTYGFYVADWNGSSWVLSGGDLWYWYPIKDFSVIEFNGADVIAVHSELPGDFSADNLDMNSTAEKFWGARNAILVFLYKSDLPFRKWGYHHVVESIPTYENADRIVGSKISSVNGQLYIHTIRTYGFEDKTYMTIDEYQSYDGEYWSLPEAIAIVPNSQFLYSRHHCPYLVFNNNMLYLAPEGSENDPIAAHASPKYGYEVETFRTDITSWVSDLSIERAEMISATFVVTGARDLLQTVIFRDRQMIYDIYFAYKFSTGIKYIKWAVLFQDTLELEYTAQSFFIKITARDKMHFITDRYKAQDFRVGEPEDKVSLGIKTSTNFALLRGSGKQLDTGFDIEASTNDTSKDPLFAAVATEGWHSWSLVWNQSGPSMDYGAFTAWDIVDGKNFWYYDRITKKITAVVNDAKSWESTAIDEFKAVVEKYYASIKVLSHSSTETWIHLPYLLAKVSEKYMVGSSTPTSGKFGFVVSRPLGGLVPIDPSIVIYSRGWLVTISNFHKFYAAFGRVQAEDFLLQIDASSPPAVINDSSLTDVIYLTLDPDEAPLSGMQRAIDGRYILMWMRNNGKLKIWQHFNRSPVVTINERVMLNSVSWQVDTRELAAHIRMLGAYVESEYTDPVLLASYGDRFVIEQNPYLMTEAECLFEAKEAVRRMKENSERLAVSIKALIFLEPQDSVMITAGVLKPWIIDSYRLVALPGMLRQDIEARQYISGQNTVNYVPFYPLNLTSHWTWDFSSGRPPATDSTFVDSVGNYYGGMLFGVNTNDGSYLSFDLDVGESISSFVVPAWFSNRENTFTEFWFDNELVFTSTESDPDKVVPLVWQGNSTFVQYIKVVIKNQNGIGSKVGITGVSLYKLPETPSTAPNPYVPPPYVPGHPWCWDFMNGYAPQPPASMQSPRLFLSALAGVNNGPGDNLATARAVFNVSGNVGRVVAKTWFGNSSNCLTEILLDGEVVKSSSSGGKEIVTTSWSSVSRPTSTVEVRVKHSPVINLSNEFNWVYTNLSSPVQPPDEWNFLSSLPLTSVVSVGYGQYIGGNLYSTINIAQRVTMPETKIKKAVWHVQINGTPTASSSVLIKTYLGPYLVSEFSQPIPNTGSSIAFEANVNDFIDRIEMEASVTQTYCGLWIPQIHIEYEDNPNSVLAAIRSVCIDPEGQQESITINFDNLMPATITYGTVVPGEGISGSALYTEYIYLDGHRYRAGFTVAVPTNAFISQFEIWSRRTGSLQDIRIFLFNGNSTTNLLDVPIGISGNYNVWTKHTLTLNSTPISSGLLRVYIDYAAVNHWHSMWHYFDNITITLGYV